MAKLHLGSGNIVHHSIGWKGRPIRFESPPTLVDCISLVNSLMQEEVELALRLEDHGRLPGLAHAWAEISRYLASARVAQGLEGGKGGV